MDKYDYNKVSCETSKGKCDRFYAITDNFSNYDVISCVTDIFSAAYIVWEELEIEYDANEDVLEDIVEAFEKKGTYIFPGNKNRTYSIKPIEIWEVVRR